MILQLIDHVQQYKIVNPEALASEMNWDIEATRRAIEDLKHLGLLDEISMKPVRCQGCKRQCSL